MSKSRFTTRQLALSGLIAALYAVLAYFGNIFGVTYGPIQCRFSEALCVLPFFMPEAVPGLFLGCLIANLLSPYGAADIVFGSLATLLAACWTRKVRRKWLAPLPPVLCNMAIIGALLGWYEAGFGAAFPAAFAYNALTVGIGEAIACYVLGGLLLNLLPRIRALAPFLKAPEQRDI